MNKKVEYVLKLVEDRDVKFIRLWFTDILGSLKSVALSPVELENAFNEGVGIDGSTIEGPIRKIEKDMIIKPDPSTFQILPWRGNESPTARMFCDLYTPYGEQSSLDSRYILKKTLDKVYQKGLTFYTHPEIEFYIFDKAKSQIKPNLLVPIDTASYFDHVPRSIGQDFRRDVINTLEKMGISVEFSHHEAGPGQNEIDLRYADALSTADNIMTFRTVVKEIALQYEMFASFMPKPLIDSPGSAMHTHMSLFEGENNIFYDANSATYGLSDIAKKFLAGLIKYAPDISIVTNQFINSYKRLNGGDEAPSFACWGANNHSTMIRIPTHKPNKALSSRIEIRTLDSAANPYLSYAVILGAGLKGIEENLSLQDETTEELSALSSVEQKALGIKELPSSLEKAISIAKNSDFLPEIVGEEMFEIILNNKYDEWKKYRSQITESELKYSFNRI